jgi:hypothetical protein
MVRRWFSVSKPPKIVRSSRIGVDNIFLMIFFLYCFDEIISFGPIDDFLDGSTEVVTNSVFLLNAVHLSMYAALLHNTLMAFMFSHQAPHHRCTLSILQPFPQRP